MAVGTALGIDQLTGGEGYGRIDEWGRKARDKTRSMLGFEDPGDPPKTPDPASQSTAGITQTEQLKKQKGRSSTRRVPRTPLGGGASLT